eukprot:gene31669-6871_t
MRLDCTTVDQATPLHYAVYHGEKEVAKLLLTYGANPSLANELGETSLHLACLQGNEELVTLLLSLPGVNPNAEAINGRSALHYAGELSVVPRMISTSKPVNHDEPSVDDCANIEASRLGARTAASELLSEGAWVDAGANEDFKLHLTACTMTSVPRRPGPGNPSLAGASEDFKLHWAAFTMTSVPRRPGPGNPSLAGASEDFKLHWAACNGHDDLHVGTVTTSVLTASFKRADINGKSNDHVGTGHSSALTASVKKGSESPGKINDVRLMNGEERSKNRVPIILAARGARCMETDCGKLDPAQPEAPVPRCGHCRSLEVLLQHGAKVNSRDWKQATPLYYAALGGCAQSVQVLLASGADHTMVDENGNTPLHGAALRGNRLTVSELLAAQGIIVDVLNKKSNEALLRESAQQQDPYAKNHSRQTTRPFSGERPPANRPLRKPDSSTSRVLLDRTTQPFLLPPPVLPSPGHLGAPLSTSSMSPRASYLPKKKEIPEHRRLENQRGVNLAIGYEPVNGALPPGGRRLGDGR